MRHFCLLFFFFPLLLQAQDSVAPKKDYSSPVLKFSPLSLIDPLQSIQFALEHQLGKRVSLQHELGYVFRYNPDWDFLPSSYDGKSWGLRLRNELRIYFDATNSGRPEGAYFAPEFLYNFVRYDKGVRVGRACSDAQGRQTCQYYQKMYYREQKQVFALHLKLGYQEIIFERLVFDIYGGLGIRHVKRLMVHPPEGLQADDHLPFNYISNWRSISLGFKLGYILFHKAPARLQKETPYQDYPYYIEQN